MAQILVAEDDAQLRNFLVRMLQRAGYRVRAAENGSQAVEMLGDQKVDLLLADVTMPGLDGFELAKQCTRHNPNVQIMFITGFAAVALKRNRPARGSSATATSVPACFHSRKAVASLKQIAEHAFGATQEGFHSRKAVASLKLR